MSNVIYEQQVDPLLPIPVVHPTLGKSCQTTPQHVVDWIFASRRSNQLPPAVLIGYSIWEDPRYLPADSEDSNDESDEAPEVVHPPLPERLATGSVKRAASPTPAHNTVSRACLKPSSMPSAPLDQTPETPSDAFFADFGVAGISVPSVPPPSGTQHPWFFPNPCIPPHLMPYAAAPYRMLLISA